jgi:hypothetical protein
VIVPIPLAGKFLLPGAIAKLEHLLQ